MNKQDLSVQFSEWLDTKPEDAEFSIFRGVAWNFNIYADFPNRARSE